MFGKSLVKLSLIAACGLMVVGFTAPVDAKTVQDEEVLVEVEQVEVEHVVVDCCPPPCITYHHHPTLRKICRSCCDPINVVLVVTDPVCCKTVEVPICLPACCDDVPRVCPRRGLLGRGVVEYEWCCGYRVKVVFRKCGDIAVHSYGR